MRLIVGLGNPGSRYENTRHNVGFWVVDSLAKKHGLRLDRQGFYSWLVEGTLAGEKVLLLKPQTYMNESGRAVAAALNYYHLAPGDLTVVCDDLDLPLGRLRLRGRGSSGGHNGLKSIIAWLGSEEFPRLRIGLGRPPAEMDPADFVLSPFAPPEWEIIKEAVQEAVQALETMLTDGLEKAMNLYNRSL